jgi:hypothetical protein
MIVCVSKMCARVHACVVCCETGRGQAFPCSGSRRYKILVRNNCSRRLTAVTTRDYEDVDNSPCRPPGLRAQSYVDAPGGVPDGDCDVFARPGLDLDEPSDAPLAMSADGDLVVEGGEEWDGALEEEGEDDGGGPTGCMAGWYIDRGDGYSNGDGGPRPPGTTPGSAV